MRDEIRWLTEKSGMSREELGRRGESYELDAEARGLLAEIEGLEWMLGRRH
jgi:hypothetical protein